MIEVKGTRSAKTTEDVTDPLGFRKPAVAGNGLLVGFAGGLLGLAVYLRSFLWFEPNPADAGVLGPEGAATDDNHTAQPRASLVAAVASKAGDGSYRSTKADAADDTTMTPPVVFGPFETGIFAPAVEPRLAGLPSREPANSGLPPFQLKPPQVVAEESTGIASAGPAADIVGEVPLDARVSAADTVLQPETGPVPARNRAPQNSSPVYLGEVGSGAAIAIAMSSLVANSSDADDDPLLVAQARSSSGSLQARSDGFRFVADTEELGTVLISYQVTDGNTVAAQTAFVTVVENRIDGTAAADLLLGTEGRDRMTAFSGDDNIAAFGGRDAVFGGLGDDNISGGAGRDTLYGDDGNDMISGGADADWIFGGDGDDRLYGEAGDDHLQGDGGHDLLNGGNGRDTLLGGDGDDTLSGGEGDDAVSGGLGNDALSGDSGNDMQFGDDGEDTLLGGAGEDILFGGQSADNIFGGADNDVLSGDAGNDTLLGDAGADLVSGGEGEDVLYGGLGNDILLGEAGNDTLAGQDGADVMRGGAGDDFFHAVLDSLLDTFDGNEGIDALSYADETIGLVVDLTLEKVFISDVEEDRFSSIEIFTGGAGDDIFIADEGCATLTGAGGADTYTFVHGDTVERPPSAFRITDFQMDDLVSVVRSGSAYGIRQAQRELEDRIEDLFEDFSDRLSLDEPKLRYFHEWFEDFRRTVIEVDFDRDNGVDLTLTMDGELTFELLLQNT